MAVELALPPSSPPGFLPPAPTHEAPQHSTRENCPLPHHCSAPHSWGPLLSGQGACLSSHKQNSSFTAFPRGEIFLSLKPLPLYVECAALGPSFLPSHSPCQHQLGKKKNASFPERRMVLDAAYEVTIRFFQTWSRLPPMDGDPYGQTV